MRGIWYNKNECGQKISVHICPQNNTYTPKPVFLKRPIYGRIGNFSGQNPSTEACFRRASGAGNNPMVGMTVSVAVAVEESLK